MRPAVRCPGPLNQKSVLGLLQAAVGRFVPAVCSTSRPWASEPRGLDHDPAPDGGGHDRGGAGLPLGGSLGPGGVVEAHRGQPRGTGLGDAEHCRAGCAAPQARQPGHGRHAVARGRRACPAGRLGHDRDAAAPAERGAWRGTCPDHGGDRGRACRPRHGSRAERDRVPQAGQHVQAGQHDDHQGGEQNPAPAQVPHHSSSPGSSAGSRPQATWARPGLFSGAG